MKSDLISLNKVCNYLRLSRFSLYRLIKKGRLTGYRTHRRWYFKPDDVEAYRNYRRRIKYYGRIFPAVVLTKYHQAPHKYQVTKKKRGLIGHLSLRTEYLKGLSLKQAAREFFKPIRYHRVRLAGGYAIIVVSERDFDRLPKAEQERWRRLEMTPERIRQEINK